jgi:hypothetical protein
MRFAAVLPACALIALATSAAAQQQTSPSRTSYTFGLSRGAGALTCTFCTGETKGGIAGLLSVETSFKRAMRVGVEANWWMTSSEGTSRSVLAAMPVFHFFPWRERPFYFKVGLGLGRFSASTDEEELRTTAMSGVIGAAWEFRLANRNAVTPYLSIVSGAGGDMRLNGARVTSQGGLSLMQYGIAYSKR